MKGRAHLAVNQYNKLLRRLLYHHDGTKQNKLSVYSRACWTAFVMKQKTEETCHIRMKQQGPDTNDFAASPLE